MHAKPGIAKKRVVQRRLHAVVNRRQSPQSKAANWLARMIAIVLNKVRGRG
jgi:hypothetical protein